MKSQLFKRNPYIIELLTPKQSVTDIDSALLSFQNKYNRIADHDCVISIPDNPMGILHFTALEVISYNNLHVNPDNIILHLNTFHRKVDLDQFLDSSYQLGIKYILCVSGDGSDKLPKLDPADLYVKSKTVTSIELLHYIKSKYGNYFTPGVAFNQYEPSEYELLKLRKKIDAGAEFIITQPVIKNNLNKMILSMYSIPVFPGAWMSKKIDLLYECVGLAKPENELQYDPVKNLQHIHEYYNNMIVYLSLVPYKKEWKKYLPYFLSTVH